MSILSRQPVAPLPSLPIGSELHFDIIPATHSAQQSHPTNIQHSLTWRPICTELACSSTCRKWHNHLDPARIPIEVYERIIDAIYASRVVDGIRYSCLAMKRCSLVCRAWRPRSQHWLLYAIELQDTYGLNRLYQLLGKASRSAWSVRELYLTGPYLHRPDSVVTSLSSNLGNRLPNIRVLSMICNPLTLSPQRNCRGQELPFLPIHPRFPLSLHSFHYLNEARFINLRFPSFTDFARLPQFTSFHLLGQR